MLWAVPKFRRTNERKLKRKFGSPEYVLKILLPKNNIKVCQDCGHHHEKGRLCGKFWCQRHPNIYVRKCYIILIPLQCIDMNKLDLINNKTIIII